MLALTALLILVPTAVLSAPFPQQQQGNQVFSYEFTDEGDLERSSSTGYHFLNGEPGVNVDGGFGFTADGRSFDVTFVADENGYQPSADFLPQVPEEPEEVREARANFYSLWEQIAAEHKRLMMERGGGEDEDSGAVSYSGGDEVDLRQGNVRSRRQAGILAPTVPLATAYYYVPQRPAVVPVYQTRIPVGVPFVVQQQQQQQQSPLRVFPAVPANQQQQQQKVAQKPVAAEPPFIPDIPETEESGVVAL